MFSSVSFSLECLGKATVVRKNPESPSLGRLFLRDPAILGFDAWEAAAGHKTSVGQGAYKKMRFGGGGQEMRRRWFGIVAVFSWSVSWLACSGGEPGTKTQEITFYSRVKGILDSRCVDCHRPGGIGPSDLTSFQSASKVAKLIEAQVVSRKMPPWLASQGCNEYVGDPSLSNEDIKAISAWVAAGTPEGKPTDLQALPKPDDPQIKRVDVSLKLPVPYTPQKMPDDYRCFLLDWPYKDTRYVTGFRVKPGNPKIVHHVIAFLAPPDTVAQFQALDDRQEGPGYDCYGGPSGQGSSRSGWIGAWAPGSAGVVYSLDDTKGVKILPGSKVVVQMHYNLLSGSAEPDQSILEMQTSDKVEQEVFVQPWANPEWLQGETMKIPAGVSDTKHSFTLDPTLLSGGRPMEIRASGLHMHKIGKKARLTVLHADGTETCVLDIQRWDFGWQRSYSLKKPVILKPGDRMSVECLFDNSPENQPLIEGKRAIPQDMFWGEGTRDEMCLGIFSYTKAP